MNRPDPQGANETRLVFLTRVLVAYMAEFEPDGLIHYDGADCDGQCLADDIQAMTDLDLAPDLNDLKKAVAFYDAIEGESDVFTKGNEHIGYLIKAARKLVR